MAKGPIQVVLNSESYITLISQQRPPMGNKDFYANNNELFSEHKRNIISQLDDIAVAQNENPYSKINYIKVRMIHKALAKSHRPTGKLFTIQNQCKLIGGAHRGEMIFEITPQSIAELKRNGILRIRPAKKGPDSVIQGISFMQQYHIVVDDRCVKLIEELDNYTYQKDKKTNEYINKPVDSYNHVIDAIRYALEPINGQGTPKARIMKNTLF